jgi:hypothetical protein
MNEPPKYLEFFFVSFVSFVVHASAESPYGCLSYTITLLIRDPVDGSV